MSSSDKTKEKLMQTMRMTKADPGKKVDTVDAKQTNAPQNDKLISKHKMTTAPNKVVKESQKLSVDPYQTGRRVWPD